MPANERATRKHEKKKEKGRASKRITNGGDPYVRAKQDESSLAFSYV